MAIPVVTNISNPFSGTFGTGCIQVFANAGIPTIWNIPPGCQAVRVRVWSGGGAQTTSGGVYGCGGGFAMKTIYDISTVTSVVINVGRGAFSPGQNFGETSSFGSFVSAVGASSLTPGYGVGGDINYTGGVSGINISGGAAGLFGNGGGVNGPGCAGGGGVSNPQPGFTGSAGSTALTTGAPPQAGALQYYPSVDFIATGGGGLGSGINGGGGGTTALSHGGIPGGGGGSQGAGGQGLVIVEW